MKTAVKRISVLLLVIALLLSEFATKQNVTQAKTVDSGQISRKAVGSSMLSLGEKASFEITESQKAVYATFTPSVDLIYNFYAKGDESIRCYLYESTEEDESNYLECEYGDTAADFNYSLKAGVTYKIKLEFAISDSIGIISLIVRAVTSWVSFDKTSETIYVGNTIQLSPKVQPELAEKNGLQWRSSNMEVATVSSTGLVTAIKEGSATIYAESWDGERAEVSIEVIKPMLSTGGTGSKTVALGEKTPFVITESGGVMYTSFTPSVTSIYNFCADSAEDVKCYLYNSTEENGSNYLEYSYGSPASFDFNLDAGVTYKIRLEFSSAASTGTISLLIRALTSSISLSNTNETISVGDTLQLLPKVEPELAQKNELQWHSSNMDVVMVNNMGLVTAIREGSATVYAESWDGKKAEISVKVLRPMVNTGGNGLGTVVLGEKTSFEVTESGGVLYTSFTPSVTSTYNFCADSVENVKCYLYNSTETDESNYLEYEYGSPASFNFNLDAGVTYKIRLEFSSVVSTGTISLLIRATTSSVSFINTSETISVGDTLQLSSIVEPELAQKNELQWSSSDTNVVTVSSTGLVTAINEGSAYVYAESWDGKKDEVYINVVKPYVYLNYSSYSLYIGQSFTLQTYSENATVDSVTYSTSKKQVATVTASGKVKAKKPGNAKITVTVKTKGGNYKLTCDVKVLNPYLNYSSLSLYKNRTKKLAVKYSTGKAVWSSSNSKVCTVSKGKVKAKKKGTATIRCKVNGVTLKCKVTVMNPAISRDSMELTDGFSGNLYIYRGAKSTKGEKWTSTNKKVATVKKGVVVAKKPGTATIKCTVDGVTVKCKVTVYKNVYIGTPMKLGDLSLDRIYYQVVKEYFSGNKLRVKVKLCNTYTDRKIKVLKVINFSQYAGGDYIRKRIVNKKVNLKAYSGKTFTFTIAKGKGLKGRIDLRNGDIATMDVETDYYSYKYTY